MFNTFLYNNKSFYFLISYYHYYNLKNIYNKNKIIINIYIFCFLKIISMKNKNKLKEIVTLYKKFLFYYCITKSSLSEDICRFSI